MRILVTLALCAAVLLIGSPAAAAPAPPAVTGGCWNKPVLPDWCMPL